jgi:two-component system, NtrC family, nitrogen regulation sensor histidine kinase NtrY
MHYSKPLFLRICLILLSLCLVNYALYQHLMYTLVFFSVISLLAIFELFVFSKRIYSVYDKTIDAILHQDFSSDNTILRTNKKYKKLGQLYEESKLKNHELASKELVYTSLLNNLDSSVLILHKKVDWEIFLMNDCFSKQFQVPKLTQWSYLRNQISSFCEVIERNDFQDLKTTIDIQLDEVNRQTFVIQCSLTYTYNQAFYIILLDSIQTVIDRKEKDAWVNLMKIIAHELLNSLTPIQSLSQNLNELVKQNELSEEDLQDIRDSVTAIYRRGTHLQQFIESYRKLAALPTPKKERILMSDLIRQALHILEVKLAADRIQVDLVVETESPAFIDKFQMEQLILNVITNSIYALESQKEKQIEIRLSKKENRLFVTFTDNGSGVDQSIESKIFLPFYTTRVNGAGIGLTLSKNIAEAHGGYLIHKTEDLKTKFVLCLMD